MDKVHFNRPLVVLAHICDAHFVGVLAVLSEHSEELAELLPNKIDDVGFLKPLAQILFVFAVVIKILKLLLIVLVIITTVRVVAANHLLLSSAVWNVCITVFAIRHKRCCLSHSCTLRVSVLHIDNSFSLTSSFCIDYFLFLIVNAVFFVAI